MVIDGKDEPPPPLSASNDTTVATNPGVQGSRQNKPKGVHKLVSEALYSANIEVCAPLLTPFGTHDCRFSASHPPVSL